jgi:hypothetical protein
MAKFPKKAHGSRIVHPKKITNTVLRRRKT